MIYARFGRGDSDVDVYSRTDGVLVWHACALGRAPVFADIRFTNAAELVAHLLAHRAAGYSVPQDAIDALAVEMSSRGEDNPAREGNGSS